MPDKHPIDYARADADVVRKKFRRRVVMFVLATVVVMGIGGGWMHSLWKPRQLGAFVFPQPMSVRSHSGWIAFYGPPTDSPYSFDELRSSFFLYDKIGIWIARFEGFSMAKWAVAIHYRTLFLLAMIPWIITLIRLIRVWKQKKVLETN